jgi:predicted transcriptional regulator
VVIKKLKLRNYNIGINVTANVEDLNIQEVSALENYNAGFYTNKSIDTLSITNSIFKHNGYKGNVNSGGSYRRGLLFQSSASTFANFYIHNNVVTDNSLVGIDINLNNYTNGIEISDNTLTRNGDAEIGVWLGKNSATASKPVLIHNNAIILSNAVRFGIEVKNPSGSGMSSGLGSIVVSNNMIGVSGHTGVSRDMGGIVVIRRKDGDATINDQPKGVVINNNIINNLQNIHANADDAYGIVVGGTNHTIKDNSIDNTEVSIQLQKENDNYSTNNNSNQANVDYYFSRDNSAEVCAYLDNNIISFSGLPRLVTGVATASFTLPNSVLNTNTGMAFCTIQSAIDDANTLAGHTLQASTGTFAENVNVNKSVTLMGADSSSTILDKGDGNYTALGGNGFSVSANNVVIKKLKLRNYNIGINVTDNIEDLTIQEVSALENFNAGFYTNKSIDTLSITNSIFKHNGYKGNVSSGGSYRRGILFQSSASNYANIYINNNTVTDNSLVGIDINLNNYTDGIELSNNILARNGDAEIGVWLGKNADSASNPVLIHNNMITLSNAVRFGIEIKNPLGSGLPTGTGSIVVSNNIIATSGHTGVSRDMGGIVVIRRKDGDATINDQPKGVVIKYNSIFNLQNIHANTDDAYGIVVGGINHTIKNNTLNNTEISIQLQKENDNYSTNNNSNQANVDYYFSRDNSSEVCAYLADNNIISSGAPRLVTGVATSSLTLPNTVLNETSEVTFCTIQDAIDDDNTLDGHHLQASAGVFAEEIFLHKRLTLKGANTGINPNLLPRNPETIIYPSTSGGDPNDPSAIVSLYIDSAASGSYINGFTFDGNNPSLTSGILINEGSTDVDAIEAIASYDGVSKISITNNIIKNYSYSGIDLYNYYNSGNITTGSLIANNLFEGIRPYDYGIAALIYNNCYTTIANNVMNGVRVGIQTGNFSQADTMFNHSITNNTVNAVRLGIWYNSHYSNATSFIINNNTVANYAGATNTTGIKVTSIQNIVGATINNNNVSNVKYGYHLWSNPTISTISITGGSVSNVTRAILADNFAGYNSNGSSSSYNVSNVLISSADSGIVVVDDALNTNNATVALTIGDDVSISANTASISVEGSDASLAISTTGLNGVISDGAILNNSGNPIDATSGKLQLSGLTKYTVNGGLNIRELQITNFDSILIAGGVEDTVNVYETLRCYTGVLKTNNNLVLKSTATTTAAILNGDASGNYIADNVTIERYVPAKASRKWILLASPITETIANTWQQQIHITGAGTGGTVCPTFTQHTNGYDATVSNAPNIYTYNSANNVGTRWTKPATTNADNLTAGKAFRVNVRGDRSLGCSLLDGSPSGLIPTAVTLKSTGFINNANLNAGDISITLNNARDISGPDKYVMIGNPYPSTVKFNTFYTGNSAKIANNYAIYIPANAPSIYSYWDGATQLFTGGTGYDNSNGNNIASGQAFFVQSTLANDNLITLNFTESDKLDGSFNGYFRPRSFNEKIKVNLLANNKKVDEVIIRFANDAGISNSEINANLDIPSINSGIAISSLKENKPMVVQTRDLATLNNDEVWLNVSANESGFYQLNFTEFDKFVGTDIFLKDHYTNAMQDVKQNATYSFLIDKDIAATKGATRFSIVFNRNIQAEYVNNNIKMYPNPASKNVTIELPQNNGVGNYHINVTDIAGKVVMQVKANGGTQQLNIEQLMTGTYLLEIIDSNGKRTIEKLVKQ